jgi:hypothetical protein
LAPISEVLALDLAVLLNLLVREEVAPLGGEIEGALTELFGLGSL